MRAEEVELLLQIAADSTLGATFNERFDGILETFATLVPSSSMTAFVLDLARETQPTPDHTLFRNGEVAQLQEYAANYMLADPMLPGLAAMDGIPTTLSDFVRPGASTRDAYTGEFLPRFGVRHIMGVSQRMPDNTLLSIGIQRDRGLRDFTARERKLVHLVAPYLARAAYGAVLREKVTAVAVSNGHGAGKSHKTGAALFDSQGAMLHADAGALALLALLTDSGSLGLDALVAEARSLGQPEVPEGHSFERAVIVEPRGVIRVRLTRVKSAESVSVLVSFELSEGGTREHFDAVAQRFQLTPRERDIVGLVIGGQSNREIGHKLGISAVTVGVMLTKVYARVGIRGRNELTALFLGGSVPGASPLRSAAP